MAYNLKNDTTHTNEAQGLKSPKKGYRFYIGIDTGVKTGIAIWDSAEKTILSVGTTPIHKAMQLVRDTWELLEGTGEGLLVRVEDARQRKWFGNAGREKLQGAGSVKRDAKIWEDFLTDLGVPFELVAPKDNKTKLAAQYFKQVTGYDKSTTIHGRDALMLVYGF